MIDYDKLQMAHELAAKLDKKCSIEICFFRFSSPRFFFYDENSNEEYYGDSLDDLITKLSEMVEPESKPLCNAVPWTININDLPSDAKIGDKFIIKSENGKTTIDKIEELVEPEPKPKNDYSVGSKWWFLDGPSFETYPEPRFIEITEQNKNHYRVDEEWWPSRESLIEAQIEYWQSLKSPEFEGEIKGFNECVKENIKEALLRGQELYHSHMESNSSLARMPCNDVYPEQCEHESDGIVYFSKNFFEFSKFPSGRMKCKKCGEFYR